MEPLVVIPARGNSKGVPGKNIKKLSGNPLISYTIDAARKVFDDRHIIVSTDSPEIKACVEGVGLSVPFLRPERLATDSSGTYEVLLHALDFVVENLGYNPDTLVLLQPTSPFRTANHIKEALELYLSDNTLEMVVSVMETKANPYFVLFEEDEEGMLFPSKKGEFSRRQDCPKVWQYNGAIYIFRVTALRERRPGEFTRIKKYVMNAEDSLDIDTPLDWQLAEILLASRQANREKSD